MRFIFLAFMIVGNLLAANWATVSSDRAVLYSDVEMSSAIGYLVKGTKLRIGEKARNKGRVYPTVYQKKIVFISKIDIQTSSEVENLQSAMERVRNIRFSKSLYNSFSVGLLYESISLSSEKNFTINKDRDITFTGLSFGSSVIKILSRYSMKMNLSYLSGSTDLENFNLIDLEFSIFYHLYRTKRSFYKAFVSGIYTASFDYEVGNIAQEGSGSGYSVGLEYSYRFRPKWSLEAAGKLISRSLSLSGESPVDFNPEGKGFSLSFSTSYTF